MKLAYVADIRLPTEKAHGLQVMRMCAAFAELGHEVRLFVPDRKNPIVEDAFSYYGLEKTFAVEKVPAIDLVPWSRFLGRFGQLVTSWCFAFGARRRLAAWKPDLVYSRDRFSALWAPHEAAHATEVHALPSSGRAVFRRIWNMSDRVVAVTEGLREDLANMGVRVEKLLVAHDAADPLRFQLGETKAASRRALGLPEDAVLAVYVGRFYPEQGIATLMAAAEKLKNAKAVFVGGEGECRNGIFAGRVRHAEVPRWLHAADLAVMPYVGTSLHVSRHASPMKLFEYLAAGLPVISSDLPSVREVLTEEAGVFVTPDDPAALAAAIDALAADPERRRAMGDSSLRLGRAHGWSARAARVLEGLPRPPGDRAMTFLRRWRAELFIFALAFALRAAYVLFFPQQPLEGGDAPVYVGLADAIRGARGWEGLPEHWQPGFPYLLAGIRALFGEALVWPRLALSALSAATAVAAMRLAGRWLGRAGAWTAGLLAALHVPMLLDAGALLTETTYAFLLAFGLLFYLTALDDDAKWRPFAAALFLGLAGTVRELGFHLLLILAAFAFLARRGRLAAAVLLGLVLFGGTVAWQQSVQAGGRVEQEARLFAKGYEETVLNDAVFQKNAFAPERLLMYPEGVMRFLLWPYRLADLSSGVSVKSAVLGLDARALRPLLPELAAKLAVSVFHWLVLAAALFGLLRGRLPGLVRLAAVLILAFACGTIVFASVGRPAGFAVYEPLARYRFPFEPLILVLAAAGLDRLAAGGRAGRAVSLFMSRQYALFVAVGATGVAMNLALTFLLTEVVGLHYMFSYVISTLAVWTIVFALHSRMTFRGHGEAERRAYARFVGLYVTLTIFNWAAVWTATSVLGVHYLLSILFVTAAVSVLSFLGNRVIVFNHAG